MYKYIDEYCVDYYEKIEKNILIINHKQMMSKEDLHSELWLNNMRKMINMACQVQRRSKREKDVIPYCNYIRLSFLHIATFFENYKPCFMVEFFSDDGDKSWAISQMRATDVLGDWQTFAEQAYRKDLWYARFYDPDAIQSLLVQTQQKLLYIWLNRARYWIRELEDMPEFQKLWVTDDFQVTVGVYRDWQEPIFRLRTNLDLLDAQGTSLAGAFFVAEKYRDVVIEEIDAETAEFINCRFEKVTFKESNLCDCRFKNCKFYGVLFQNCKFAGASFEKNVFAACKFQNCDFNPDSEAMNAYKLYRGTNFNGNKMQKCSFVDCDLQGMHQQDNDVQDCEGAFVC